jgi:hypothetical protein
MSCIRRCDHATCTLDSGTLQTSPSRRVNDRFGTSSLERSYAQSRAAACHMHSSEASSSPVRRGTMHTAPLLDRPRSSSMGRSLGEEEHATRKPPVTVQNARQVVLSLGLLGCDRRGTRCGRRWAFRDAVRGNRRIATLGISESCARLGLLCRLRGGCRCAWGKPQPDHGLEGNFSTATWPKKCQPRGHLSKIERADTPVDRPVAAPGKAGASLPSETASFRELRA